MTTMKLMIAAAGIALSLAAVPADAKGLRPQEPGTSSSGGATPVPEPGMMGIMGLALGGLVIGRRRQSRKPKS